jgi:hypothetical protein
MATRLSVVAGLVAGLLAVVFLARPAQAQNTSTVTLAQQNNSGISGTAVLTQVGSDLRVELTLTGAAAGSSHPYHIHSGACPSPGGVVHPLTNAVDGKSTTTLAGVTLASVADGAHAINGHMSQTDMSNYINCGNIPRLAAAAATTAPTTAAATAAATTSTMATAVVPAAMPKTGGGGSAQPTPAAWPILLLLAFVLAAGGVMSLRRATD